MLNDMCVCKRPLHLFHFTSVSPPPVKAVLFDVVSNVDALAGGGWPTGIAWSGCKISTEHARHVRRLLAETGQQALLGLQSSLARMEGSANTQDTWFGFKCFRCSRCGQAPCQIGGNPAMLRPVGRSPRPKVPGRWHCPQPNCKQLRRRATVGGSLASCKCGGSRSGSLVEEAEQTGGFLAAEAVVQVPRGRRSSGETAPRVGEGQVSLLTCTL